MHLGRNSQWHRHLKRHGRLFALLPASLPSRRSSTFKTDLPGVAYVVQELRPQIHGMVHCSGGAQTKVLHFVDGVHVIKDNLFPIPPLFRIIQVGR